MKKYLLLILLSSFILLVCGCDKQKPKVTPSGRVVRIGVIAPMSGPDEKSGESVLLGIRTALKMQPYLNNGDKIELTVEDNGGSGGQTLTAMQKLKDDNSVSGVLLMGKSDAVLELVPEADTFMIPVFALIATHPGITENNHFISQLSFDDVFQGDVAALYARDELLISRAAVFSEPGNAHYTFLANEFIRKFTSVGGEIIRHVTTEPGQEDLQEIVNNLRDKNVELLYLVVRPEQVIRIVRAIRATGWKPKLVGSDGLGSAILLQHKNDIEQVRGMMVTDFYNIDLPETQYGRTASRIFKKSFSAPGTTYAGLGCEGASILINAIDRCQTKTDRSCVNNMLRSTNGFEGLFGRISIHEDGKSERPIFMNVFDGRHMKSLVKVY